MTEERSIETRLQEPFGPDEVKQRPGRGGGAAYDYIDARSAHQRLDDVFGAGGWATTFTILDPESKAVECKLSALFDTGWVTKTDVGYPNSADDADHDEREPLKAAYSDALKRAAVQFGIGRHLYAKTPTARRAPPTSIAPPEASPSRSYDADELLSLMGQFGVTKEQLIKVAGKSTNGNPQVSKWLSMNKGKTLNDLVSRAVDAREGASA